MEDRLLRYGPARLRAEEFAAWLITHEAELDDGSGLVWDVCRGLIDCGDLIVFRDYAPAGVPENRLVACRFCRRHLVCPFCVLRRTAKILRTYSAKVLDVWSRLGGLLYLVTGTLRDGPDLQVQCDRVRASHSAMIRARREWWLQLTGRARGRAWSVACHAKGGVYAFEVKRGSGSGLWHAHWHAVWLCDEAPSVEEFSDEWRRRTGDSWVVDCRPFHCMADGGAAVRAALDVDGASAVAMVAHDLAEVLKYPIKLQSLPFRDLWDAFLVLRGRRQLGSFGEFHGWEVSPELEDAPLCVDDLPFVELVARYVVGEGRYIVEREG